MQLHAPCARPDPISPPASRSLARHGHGPATPVLRRLDSPDSILDRLEQRPTLSTKAIRDFRRKWSADGVHWGGVRKLLSLSEPDERGVACTLPTPGPRPRKPPEQDGRRGSKAERAASVLCAAARGRAVRRELGNWVDRTESAHDVALFSSTGLWTSPTGRFTFKLLAAAMFPLVVWVTAAGVWTVHPAFADTTIFGDNTWIYAHFT